MLVEFKYKHHLEYIYEVYSNISITGDGVWDVDEFDLSEFIKSENEDKLSFKEFIIYIKNYFYNELDMDPDFCIFDEEDIKKLYKEIYND